MLLYAKTDEEIYPNNEYQMSGNHITVRTLDLNCDFAEIATQLDGIVQNILHYNMPRRVRPCVPKSARISPSSQTLWNKKSRSTEWLFYLLCVVFWARRALKALSN